MNRFFGISALVVTFATGMCLAQSDSSPAPSLADVARQQQHAKKAAEKVFTDEDLPSRSGPAIQAAPAVQQPVSKAEASDGTEKADRTVKPDADAKKKGDPSAELKSKLDRYTKERDAWQQSVKRYEDLLAGENDEFRRETYEAALNTDRHNVEVYQAKIDEIQASQTKGQQGPAPETHDDTSAGASGGGHK